MKKNGRPDHYKKEYCDLIIDYFKRKCTPTTFPTFAGFAVSIDVHVETLLNWCKVYPSFLESYRKAKNIQSNCLVENSITGRYKGPGGFLQLAAKNIIGWRDKNEHDIKLQGVDANEDDVIEFLKIDDKKLH